jgi:hypothetical protein
MNSDALKSAIQEALQAQFNAGAAITRVSLMFDALHPAPAPAPAPEPEPQA